MYIIIIIKKKKKCSLKCGVFVSFKDQYNPYENYFDTVKGENFPTLNNYCCKMFEDFQFWQHMGIRSKILG